MKQRTLATVALWALVILLPLLLDKWGAFLLVAVFGCGAFLELLGLLRLRDHAPDARIAIPAFILLLGSFILIPPWWLPPVALVMPVFIGTCAACLFLHRTGFASLLMLTLGALTLVILPFGSISLIIHESGLVLAIWVLAVTKFSDVGALLTGMAIGKNRMAPRYSPNKTWEGLAGGLLLAMVVSVLFVLFGQKWLPEALTPLHAAWSSLFIALAGVLGDLTESALKREAGTKDSGNAFPGIGGFLDLTDSMLLAFPTAYFLIWIIF